MKETKYICPTIKTCVTFSEEAYYHLLQISQECQTDLEDVINAPALISYGLADIAPDKNWNPFLNGEIEAL